MRKLVTKDDLIRFVRRNGPLAARVVFLTIEDGSDLPNRDAFEDYYGHPETQQVWEPRPPLPDEYFGLPGEYIPRLMLALTCDDIGSWKSYKANELYVRDNCNIKYYPIAKKKQDHWPEFLSEEGDFKPHEYLRRCHSAERHEAILREHGGAFSPNKLIVVLAAHDAWAPFLASGVFPGEQLVDLKTLRDGKGQFVGRLFGTEQGEFRYCYFQMFCRPPASDSDVIMFAEQVRLRAAHLLDPLRASVGAR